DLAAVLLAISLVWNCTSDATCRDTNSPNLAISPTMTKLFRSQVLSSPSGFATGRLGKFLKFRKNASEVAHNRSLPRRQFLVQSGLGSLSAAKLLVPV